LARQGRCLTFYEFSLVASLACPGDIRMKTIKIFAWFAVLVLGAHSLLNAAPIPTAPIYTNKLKFRIPFHFDSAEISRLVARQIQLYVSRDRGARLAAVSVRCPRRGKVQLPGAGGRRILVHRPHAGCEEPSASGRPIRRPRFAGHRRYHASQTRARAASTRAWKSTTSLVGLGRTPRSDAVAPRVHAPGSTDWQPVSVVPKAADQTGWAIPQGGPCRRSAARSPISRRMSAKTKCNCESPLHNQAVPRPDPPGSRQPVARGLVVPSATLWRSRLPETFSRHRAVRNDEGGAKDDAGDESVRTSAIGREGARHDHSEEQLRVAHSRKPPDSQAVNRCAESSVPEQPRPPALPRRRIVE